MDGTDADISGAPVGAGLRHSPIGDLPRSGLCEVTPLRRARDGFAEVIEGAHRDLRQALVFALPEEPPRPLAELLDRWPRGRVVALICLCEQPEAGLYFGVKPATVLWRRLTAPVVRYWAIKRLTCWRE